MENEQPDHHSGSESDPPLISNIVLETSTEREFRQLSDKLEQKIDIKEGPYLKWIEVCLRSGITLKQMEENWKLDDFLEHFREQSTLDQASQSKILHAFDIQATYDNEEIRKSQNADSNNQELLQVFKKVNSTEEFEGFIQVCSENDFTLEFLRGLEEPELNEIFEIQSQGLRIKLKLIISGEINNHLKLFERFQSFLKLDELVEVVKKCINLKVTYDDLLEMEKNKISDLLAIEDPKVLETLLEILNLDRPKNILSEKLLNTITQIPEKVILQFITFCEGKQLSYEDLAGLDEKKFKLKLVKWDVPGDKRVSEYKSELYRLIVSPQRIEKTTKNTDDSSSQISKTQMTSNKAHVDAQSNPNGSGFEQLPPQSQVEIKKSSETITSLKINAVSNDSIMPSGEKVEPYHNSYSVKSHLLNPNQTKTKFLKQDESKLNPKGSFNLIKISRSQQNQEMVENLTLCTEDLVNLSNFIDGGSSRYDIYEGYLINFRSLNKVDCQTLGIFGRNDLIKKFLEEQFGLEDCTKLVEQFDDEQPGLYLVPCTSGSDIKLQVVILWSGTQQKMLDSKYPSNLDILLVRFLSQLASHVIVFIDDRDMKILKQSRISQVKNNQARKKRFHVDDAQIRKEEIQINKGFEITFKNYDRDIGLASNGLTTDVFYSEKIPAQTSENTLILKQQELSRVRSSFENKMKNAKLKFGRNLTTEMKKWLLVIFKKDGKLIEIEKEEESDMEIVKAIDAQELLEDYRQCKIIELLKNKYSKTSEILLQNLKEGAKFMSWTVQIFQSPENIFRNGIKFSFNSYNYALLKDVDTYVEEYYSPYEVAVIDAMLKHKNLNSSLLYDSNLDSKSIAEKVFEMLTTAGIDKSYLEKIKGTYTRPSAILREKAIKYCSKHNLSLQSDIFLSVMLTLHENLMRMIKKRDDSWKIESEWEFQKTVEKITKIKMENADSGRKKRVILETFDELKEEIERECSHLTNEREVRVTDISLFSDKTVYYEMKFNYTLAESVLGNEERKWVFSRILTKNEGISQKNDDTGVLQPYCFKIGELKTSIEIKNPWIYPLKNDLVLMLYNRMQGSEWTVFNIKTEQKISTKSFGNKILHVSFDIKDCYLAIVSKMDSTIKLVVFVFDPNFKVHNHELEEDIAFKYNISEARLMSLEYGKKAVWILDGNNTLRKIVIKSANVAGMVNFPPEDIFNSMLATSDGTAMILTSQKRIMAIMTDTLHQFEIRPEELGNRLSDLRPSSFHLKNNIQNHFICYDSLQEKVLSYQVEVSSAQSELQLREITKEEEKGDINTSKEIERSFLNFFFEIYDKFASQSLLIPLERQIIGLNLLVVTSQQGEDMMISSEIFDFMHNLQKRLEKTQKPLVGVNLAKNLKIVKDLDSKEFQEFTKNLPQRKTGDWIQEIICFLPIQIARAEGNNFHIMTNQKRVLLDEVTDAYDLKDKIDFELFESILNDWKNGVKVISSMGKQSTGKSYTLNHLAGSSFAVSGARCTDGCWMTMKITPECLYIILDFEGIGSFERSDQEDMLLSLFNSAISGTTLFKTEYRLERELEQLFSRFNSGANVFKDSQKIFKGLFNIIIKDVADRDYRELTKEFQEKISIMVKKDSKQNFLKTLYKAGFQIHPFPSLESPEYYYEMEVLRNDINDLPFLFQSGREFLETIKLLMAKLAILDFGCLDRQGLEMRIKSMKKVLPNCLEFGQTSPPSVGGTDNQNVLRSLDNLEEVILSKRKISIDLLENSFELDDLQHHFSLDSKRNPNIQPFRNQFFQLNKLTSQNIKEWDQSYRLYLDQILQFRKERVEKWLDINLKKYPKEDHAVKNIYLEFDSLFSKIKTLFEICKENCSHCYALCTIPVNHQGQHYCASNHECDESCQFCQKEGINNNRCYEKLGHQGKHSCREINHTCGMTCIYSIEFGCERQCFLDSGHEGDHRCDSKMHKCRKLCSLDNCGGLCDLNADSQHSVHKCVKQCRNRCAIKTCSNVCAAQDHFHGYPELSQTFKKENGIPIDEGEFYLDDGKKMNYKLHICGLKHRCDQECDKEGFCKVSKEKKITQELFSGQRGAFKYNKVFEEKGEKLLCIKEIAPFETTHEGSHEHTIDHEFKHHCEAKCPTCENICDKPFGHEGPHNTSHGNMTKMYFVSNLDNLDIGDHKYVVGEPAEPEMCHMFCKSIGRGHIHVTDCGQPVGECAYQNRTDQRRHANCEYGPDEHKSIPKDELQHKIYWESINFEDPCSQEEGIEFGLCPFYCAAEEHEKDNEKVDQRRYCTLPLWHEKVTKLEDIGKTSGFLSSDGHYYPACNHKIGKGYHIIFVLDASGSMSGDPWKSLMNAVDSFITFRDKICQADLISAVTFESDAKIIFEGQKIGSYASLRSSIVCTGGGTQYDAGLRKASQIMANNDGSGYIPVLIFFSDGYPGSDGINEMKSIYSKFGSVGKELRVIAMGFGSANIPPLKALADAAKGSYLQSVDSIQLSNSFQNVAGSIGNPRIGLKSKK